MGSILSLPAKKQSGTLPRVSVGSGFVQNKQPRYKTFVSDF